MQWIKRAWRGEEKLWKAFYYSMGIIFLVGGVYGGAAVYFCMDSIKDAIQNYTPPTSTTGPYSPSSMWWLLASGAFASYLFVYPLSIWQAIIVWRCSFNTNEKYWGYIARTLVLLMGLWGVVDLVEGGLNPYRAIFGNKTALYDMTCQLNMEYYRGGGLFIDGKQATKEFLDKHPFDHKGCIEAFIQNESSWGKQSTPIRK